jgi:hypothetical protein
MLSPGQVVYFGSQDKSLQTLRQKKVISIPDADVPHLARTDENNAVDY